MDMMVVVGNLPGNGGDFCGGGSGSRTSRRRRRKGRATIIKDALPSQQSDGVIDRRQLSRPTLTYGGQLRVRDVGVDKAQHAQQDVVHYRLAELQRDAERRDEGSKLRGERGALLGHTVLLGPGANGGRNVGGVVPVEFARAAVFGCSLAGVVSDGQVGEDGVVEFGVEQLRRGGGGGGRVVDNGVAEFVVVGVDGEAVAPVEKKRVRGFAEGVGG